MYMYLGVGYGSDCLLLTWRINRLAGSFLLYKIAKLTKEAISERGKTSLYKPFSNFRHMQIHSESLSCDQQINWHWARTFTKYSLVNSAPKAFFHEAPKNWGLLQASNFFFACSRLASIRALCSGESFDTGRSEFEFELGEVSSVLEDLFCGSSWLTPASSAVLLVPEVLKKLEIVFCVAIFLAELVTSCQIEPLIKEIEWLVERNQMKYYFGVTFPAICRPIEM